jgi:hypothetical protein
VKDLHLLSPAGLPAAPFQSIMSQFELAPAKKIEADQ